MPTYAYRGSVCTHEFEMVQKYADTPLTECIECGGPIRRVFQPVGVVFKGSGWYINDSRPTKSNPSPTDSSGDSSSATPGESKEGKVPSGSTASTNAATPKEPIKSAAKSAD